MTTKNTDIVKELRERSLRAELEGEPLALLDEAADEIERLRLTDEERDEARRLAEKYRNLSCDSQDEADETLLPWETTNQNEL